MDRRESTAKEELMADGSALVLLAGRSYLYTTLARAFACEPDEELASLCSGQMFREACLLCVDSVDSSGVVDGGGEVAEALEVLGRFGVQLGVAEAASAFTRLFIGPETLPAPPWESMYVNAEPLLLQASTLAVRYAYRDAGFMARGYPHEPDDHIATELSFMAALSGQTLALCEKGDFGAAVGRIETQHSFLRDHLSVWVGTFSHRLREGARAMPAASLYASLGVVTAALCENDMVILDELLEILAD